MPLYAIIYIFIFFFFAFGSTYMHFEEGRGYKNVIIEALSYIFLIAFIILYFESEKYQINSIFIAAMLLFSISWEVLSFKKDVALAKKDFGIKQRDLVLYTSIGVLFILPAYLAGFALLF